MRFGGFDGAFFFFLFFWGGVGGSDGEKRSGGEDGEVRVDGWIWDVYLIFVWCFWIVAV